MKGKIVLLHGFLGSSDDWSFLRKRLHDFECFTPTIEELDYSSLPACTESLYRWVTREVGSPFSLIGYSLGGRLALHLALEYPKILSSLVIIGANPGIEDIAERARRLESDIALSKRLEKEGMESFLSQWYAQPLFAPLVEKQELFSPVLERRRDSNPLISAGILRGLSVGAQTPLWMRLPEIGVATLLLTGGRDAKYQAISDRMASLMPDAQCASIADAGHAVHLEAPETTFGIISDFLKRTPICS